MARAKRGAKKSNETVSSREASQDAVELDENSPPNQKKVDEPEKTIKKTVQKVIASLESDEEEIAASEDLADEISDEIAEPTEPNKKQAKAKNPGRVPEPPKNVVFKKRGGAATKKRSMSSRAGVVMPVARIRNQLKQKFLNRLIIQKGAAVYMAGVLDYLCVEMLELSGNAAQQNKKKRINPRHLTLAVRQDEELHELLKHVIISQGGVVPHIEPVLLPKPSAKSKAAK